MICINKAQNLYNNNKALFPNFFGTKTCMIINCLKSEVNPKRCSFKLIDSCLNFNGAIQFSIHL